MYAKDVFCSETQTQTDTYSSLTGTQTEASSTCPMLPALVVDPAFVLASAGAAPLHLAAAVGAGDQRDERGRAAVVGLDRARRVHGDHRCKLYAS